MDRRLYRTGQFARKAAVSIRTLRFYDRAGLLAPSAYTAAGYRLYTDFDLVRLQQILALKFLGFALDEIQALLRASPRGLAAVLAQQKAMMQAKRVQLDSIIQALDEAEKLLETGQPEWESLIRVIQVIQMDQNKDWVKQYFTPEQLQQMEALSVQSYSESARGKMAARSGAWTEGDQERASAQWAAVGAELHRLAAADADPAGAEAQALARQYSALIGAFTGGDPEIAAGLARWWQNHEALPEAQRPVQAPWPPEDQAYLDRVLDAYRQQQSP